MALYEYECENCGVIEVLQKITEEPLEECPNCKAPVKKLISAPGVFNLKGKGFYETDYVKKNKPKEE